MDGPLRAGFYGVGEVAGTGVDVVAAEDVGDEEGVEVSALEELGEGGPVVDGGEVGGLVGGVAPEAGGLVAGAYVVVLFSGWIWRGGEVYTFLRRR